LSEKTNVAPKKSPTTVDGVRAIEVRYRPIRETDGDEIKFYRTAALLNSPLMGALTHDRYLPVLEITDQSIEVFKLQFIQTAQAAGKFADRELGFSWISLYMPLRLLRRPDCLKTVAPLAEKYKISPDKVCFEISPALLDESDDRCAESIHALRRAGYHTMLTEVGGDSCPIMKLAKFNLDYIMLDPSLTQMIGTGERADLCVKSMISFVNELGAEPIATGVSDRAVCETLSEFECLYYTGDLAGKYVLERYMRGAR
jgi:EAL domain-containing protein (putative c-di-GMP-specific phosphodiesterase class I)